MITADCKHEETDEELVGFCHSTYPCQSISKAQCWNALFSKAFKELDAYSKATYQITPVFMATQPCSLIFTEEELQKFTNCSRNVWWVFRWGYFSRNLFDCADVRKRLKVIPKKQTHGLYCNFWSSLWHGIFRNFDKPFITFKTSYL